MYTLKTYRKKFWYFNPEAGLMTFILIKKRIFSQAQILNVNSNSVCIS